MGKQNLLRVLGGWITTWGHVLSSNPTTTRVARWFWSRKIKNVDLLTTTYSLGLSKTISLLLTLFRRFIRPDSTRVDLIRSYHVKVLVSSFNFHIKLLAKVYKPRRYRVRKLEKFPKNRENPRKFTLHKQIS